MNPVNIGLVGIGGFGQTMLKYIHIMQTENRLNLAAVCDVNLAAHEQNLAAYQFGDVRKYNSFEAFLAVEQALDAVILATPIPLHAEMAILAMLAGNNVLVEKPPAVCIQDMDRMIAVNKCTNTVCAVGFQHTSEISFQKFLALVSQGSIGQIKSITAAGLWKRSKRYFSRTPWAGKLLFEDRYVLDGTINNPFSHLLMNCLILSGLNAQQEVMPEWVQAELYHANDIEAEDTSCLRIKMNNNIEILFYASICGDKDYVPFITVEGSTGKAYWDYEGWIRCWNSHGELRQERKIACDPRYDHLVNFTDFLQGRVDQLSCPLALSRNFVLTANLAFESSRVITRISEDHIEKRNGSGQFVDCIKDPDDFVSIKNISEVIRQAVSCKQLFSELGIQWAKATMPFRNAGYHRFMLIK